MGEVEGMLSEKKVLYENNAFDIIRLWATIQVLVGHCSQHLQIALPIWIRIWFSFPGVVVLFVISGFLVTASWDKMMGQQKKREKYLLKRASRIFPGLWCSIIVSSVCIFLLYPQRPNLLEGFVYTITQFSGCNFYTGDWLRGYGVGAPNGSLWTIIVELQFYVFIMFAWNWLKKQKVISWLIIIFLCSGINVATDLLGGGG